MTDKERMIKKVTEAGLEVSVIGCTIQWSNPNWTTICYFDENGNFIKSERIW